MVFGLSGALAACGDDAAPPGATETCVDYSAVSGSPSFKDDVVPIFQQSCALATVCHQSGSSNPQEGLALGLPLEKTMDQAAVDAVYAGIVGQDAKRSDMKLVVAGDPAASWLLAKCEYQDFTACDAIACSAKGCGTRMPSSSPPLGKASLATIRAWIASGAPNQ